MKCSKENDSEALILGRSLTIENKSVFKMKYDFQIVLYLNMSSVYLSMSVFRLTVRRKVDFSLTLC